MSQLVITPTFLSKADAATLHHRSARFYPLVALVWIAIAGLVAIAPPVMTNGLRSWPIAITVFIGIGLFQYCLLHAAHEASHHDLHPRSWTRLPMAFLVAYPIGLTLSFREEHLGHHAHLGDPALDADFFAYEPFPASKSAFLRSVAVNFSGIGAIAHALQRARNRTVRTPWQDTAALVCTQGVMAAGFMLTLDTASYVVYWLLPLLTVVKGLAQLRGLAEHGHQQPGESAALRTFLGNGLASRFLGVFGFRHHAEHHLYPMVPFEQLDEVRARMLHAPAPSTGRRVVIDSYPGGPLQFLWHAFRALPWTAASTAPGQTA